jgi:hypothetical protein
MDSCARAEFAHICGFAVRPASFVAPMLVCIRHALQVDNLLLLQAQGLVKANTSG